VCFYVCIDVFLYFRSYLRCILAFLYLCAAVYGVIKKEE